MLTAFMSSILFIISCFSLFSFLNLLFEVLILVHGMHKPFNAEGDGSKIYVSCISFRDPVSEDIADAYRISPNSFADKCICLVSRAPCFRLLKDALEEIFSLCFSPSGSRYDAKTNLFLNYLLK